MVDITKNVIENGKPDKAKQWYVRVWTYNVGDVNEYTECYKHDEGAAMTAAKKYAHRYAAFEKAEITIYKA